MTHSDISFPLDDLIGDTSDIVWRKVPVLIKGITIQVYRYHLASASDETSSVKKPVIIGLHGGPGFTHNYILPLKLLCRHGYEVILYDQGGCGESKNDELIDNIEKKAPWLLTLEYYLEELYTIITYCDISHYYLYGSSWGTILAQEYAVAYCQTPSSYPGTLHGILLDGALCDAQLYIRSQWSEYISRLPTYSQKLLRKLTDEKDFDNPIYSQFDRTLASQFTLRIIPTPDCFKKCLATCNNEIYVKMQGASEFTIGGVLENWSITDRLHHITVPTLVIRGEYDTMTEECSMAIVNNVSTAWPLVTIKRASHCKLLEEPQDCIEAMHKFLSTIESEAK